MPRLIPPWDQGTGSDAPPDVEGIQAFRRALLTFFRERQRELPWRDRPSPYGTLVSEVMLQQTRVETVVPYYLRWMERFPDPETLAEADEEEVLRLWQGLGYYSRARNLQGAVREVVVRHGGEIPRDPGLLRELPGVGPYTAGAVASIAFGVPEPAVDGNVRRVLARLRDVPDPRPRELEAWARTLVDPEAPGDFNQALMELGATVCTPRAPDCLACPVAGACLARERGTVAERPRRKRRGPVPHLEEVVVVLLWGDRVLLRRRPSGGLLAGMWECPGRTLSGGEDPAPAAMALARELLAWTPGPAGGAPDGGRPADLGAGLPLSAVEHLFSHRKMTYRPYLFFLPGVTAHGGGGDPETGEALPPGGGGLRWLPLGALEQVPLSVAQLRILEGAGKGTGGGGAEEVGDGEGAGAREGDPGCGPGSLSLDSPAT